MRRSRGGMRVAALLAAALWTGSALARLAPGEESFLRFLIDDLRALTTAERYIEKRLKEVTNRTAGATLRFAQADILRARGDEEGFRKRIDELARQFPGHPRSGTANLQVLLSRMNEVGALRERAEEEPDKTRKAAIRRQMGARFAKVLKGFDQLIARLRARVRQDRKDDAVFALYAAEFHRINVLWLYQGYLDPEAEKGERTGVLKRGLAEAETFVEERYEFPLFRFRAQLLKGRFLTEFERFDEAAEAFEILTGIRPRGAKQTPEYVREVRDIRLQAHLYATECFIRAGRYDEAEGISGRAVEDPFLKPAAEDPKLRDYWVRLLLARGVTLGGVGRDAEAADLILGIIHKYQTLCEERGDDKACRYVVDAQGALGEMADLATVTFAPEVLHQAGIGLIAKYDWDRARALFHRALRHIRPGQGELAGRILLDLAKAWYLDGGLREACFAYLTIERVATDERTLSDGAQGALAAAQKFQDESPAARRVLARAEEFFGRYGKGYERELKKLGDGRDLFDKGQFGEAREKFLSVSPTYQHRNESRTTPFYWRARAMAAYCLYQLDEKKNAAPAEAELEEVLEKAQGAGEVDGASTAVLYLSVIALAADPPRVEEAIEWLKLYDGPLASASEARDGGLRNYVKALAAKGAFEEAWKRFERLRTDFPDAAVALEASLELAQAASLGNRPVLAARAAAWWWTHERVRPIRRTLPPSTRLWFAEILKDGGEEHIRLARAIAEEIWAKPADADVRVAAGVRIVAISVRLGGPKDLDRAVEIGEELKKGIDPRRPGPYDTDLLYELGEAYYQRAQRTPSTSARDLKEAQEDFYMAVAYLQYRRKLGAKFEAQYWRAFLRLLQVYNARKLWGEMVVYYERLRDLGDLPKDPQVGAKLKAVYEEALGKSGRGRR